LLATAGIAIAIGLEACANDGGVPLGTDDNQDAETPAIDGSKPDRYTPPFDSGTAEDASDGSTTPPKDASTDTGVKDSGTDAADGALVDAGPTTSLFFLGDFATNNTSQLGDALLPTSSAAPVVITDGVHTAKQVVAFDALANGSKIVVAADLMVTGRFDIVVANRNGSAAVVIATMSAATAKPSDVVISPDGTKVAYIADSDTAGAYDAYVAPIAGGAAPVRVSPRAAASTLLDAQSIAWSRDSVYVAAAGDFTVDSKNELYVTDTSAVAPTPVAALAEATLPAPTGTVGVSTALRPIWTSGGKVCVKADLTGAPATFRLYCANANGTGFAEPTHLPALPAQVGSYGLSPDGATIAFTADVTTPAAYEIYTMLADDSAAAARITSGSITVAAATAFRGPSFNIPLIFSPDATNIAFAADIATDNRYELYVVAANGATSEKRLAVVGAAGDDKRDVQAIAWAPDSSTLAFVADHRADNDAELFRVANVTTTDQAPILVRGVAASGDITDLLWRP
jgi:Tol biopolymer transport system component